MADRSIDKRLAIGRCAARPRSRPISARGQSRRTRAPSAPGLMIYGCWPNCGRVPGRWRGPTGTRASWQIVRSDRTTGRSPN